MTRRGVLRLSSFTAADGGAPGPRAWYQHEIQGIVTEVLSVNDGQ